MKPFIQSNNPAQVPEEVYALAELIEVKKSKGRPFPREKDGSIESNYDVMCRVQKKVVSRQIVCARCGSLSCSLR